MQFPNTIFTEYSMPAFDAGKKPIKKPGREILSNRTLINGNLLLFNKLNVRQKRVWCVNAHAENSVCSSEFLAFEPNQNVVNPDFLRHYLLTDSVTKFFIDHSKGTSNSQKRIAPSDFTGFEVALPKNITEQFAIASVLNEYDDLISTIEDEIEKKKAIKQGAMQQLLTGKKRLPGFEGEWVETVLGNVSSINRGGSPRPIEKYITESPEGINWIKIGDVGVGAKYIDKTEEKIIPEGVSLSRFVNTGDLLLSNSMSFGRPSLLSGEILP